MLASVPSPKSILEVRPRPDHMSLVKLNIKQRSYHKLLNSAFCMENWPQNPEFRNYLKTFTHAFDMSACEI